MLVSFRRSVKMLNFDGKLIAATRKREVLYNPANKSRMYQDLKAQAWSEIAEELGAPIKNCKARWASLRDRYRRIQKAEQDAFLRGKKLYYRWKWYKPLSFLSSSSEDETQNSFQDFSQITELEIESILSIDQFQKMNCTSSSEKIDEDKKFEALDPIQYSLTPTQMDNKRDSIDDFSPSAAKACKLEPNQTERYSFSKSKTVQNVNGDATSMFFMSLAERIKVAELPLLILMQLEADILNFTISQLEEIQANK